MEGGIYFSIRVGWAKILIAPICRSCTYTNSTED